METKFIQLENVKIAYYDVNRQNENIILFIHGNSNSKKSFLKQAYDKKLANNRLIMIDLPGHGESTNDNKADFDCSTYSIPYYAEIIREFINELGLKNINLYGHSLGGHIAIHVAAIEQNNSVKSLMISQTPPVENLDSIEKGFNPVDEMSLLFSPSIESTQARSLLVLFFNHLDNDTFELFKNDILTTSPLCRQNLGGSLNPNLPDLKEVTKLKKLTIPKLIIHSKHDPLINNDYVHGLGVEVKDFFNSKHYPHWEEAQKVNKTLSSFVNNIQFTAYKEESNLQ